MGKPKNLNMDNEFKSTELVRYLKDENIKVYYSYADEAFESMKNPIIERFWRTLAQLLRTYSLNTGEKKWYLYLSRVVMNYNKTGHSSIIQLLIRYGQVRMIRKNFLKLLYLNSR